MAEPFFNPKDAKYKCFLELLHVKTGATLILLIAALLHLVFAYDICSDTERFKRIWSLVLIVCIYVFGYVFALFGIIYSKPKFMFMTVVLTRLRIIAVGAVALLFTGALLPFSTSVRKLCRYFIKQMWDKDMDNTIVTLVLGIVLIVFVVQAIADFCVYDVVNKCRQYFLDKAAFGKLTLPQSKVNLPLPTCKV